MDDIPNNEDLGSSIVPQLDAAKTAWNNTKNYADSLYAMSAPVQEERL